MTNMNKTITEMQKELAELDNKMSEILTDFVIKNDCDILVDIKSTIILTKCGRDRYVTAKTSAVYES